jgi:transcriptional regulator with XRE-family HTH domain/Zn-dependent peptidase ImmA (M78 family)
MITNDRQLQVSRAQATRFRESLSALENGSLNNADLQPSLKKAQIDAVRGQLVTLEREIEDYEKLRSSSSSSIQIDSLADLPVALIRARIATGLTQRELAERIGLKEQQIQRYEANEYDGASFARLVDIADAIGLKLQRRVELSTGSAPAAIAGRLTSIGFDADFIKRRIAPDLELSEAHSDEIARRVSSVFGWSEAALRGSATLDPTQFGGATARFKMPKGREGRSAAIYTAYAYRLATICAKAHSASPRFEVPSEWRKFRTSLIDRYGAVNFKTSLLFAWDLGIVVLPLSDPGAFHGACWRVSGVNVIVLKQAIRYPARWLFDLLHEIRHAAEKPEQDEFEVVEGAETSDERRTSREEQLASWFAGQVALDGRAEAFVKEALEVADNDLRRLKKAVEAIARRHDVSLGQLANYTAFRLSLQGHNWWGTAANLQENDFDPLLCAREVFFERFKFAELSSDEHQLLTLALHDED